MSELRFSIQAWELAPGAGRRWGYAGDVAECDTAEELGVALVTLAADGEWSDTRRAGVWDRREDRYVTGGPW